MRNKYYFVTGTERSGTSAMMCALEAGGLSVVYDNVRSPDFFNPDGYYELSKERFNSFTLVREFRGQVIKVHLEHLCEKIKRIDTNGDYIFICMMRDFEEIKKSMQYALNKNIIPNTRVAFEDRRQGRINYLKQFGKVLTVSFSEMRSNAVNEFRRIRYLIPELNIEKAAGVIR